MRTLALLTLLVGLALLGLVLAFFVGRGGADVLARSGAGAGNDARANSALEAGSGADSEQGGPARGEGRVALGGSGPSAEESAPKPPAAPRLVGRVLGPDGAPLAGARVLAAAGEHWGQVPLDVEALALPKGWPAVVETQSDAEGRFAFEGLKSGPLRLALRAHGCAPRREERLSLPPRYATHDLGDLALERAVVLAGRVVDRAGQGVTGASILLGLDGQGALQGISAPGRGILLGTSAADGAFRVDEVPPGPWQLIVDAPGYAVGEEEGRSERGGETRTNLYIRLELGSDCCGRVRPEDGALPAGLRVVARVSDEREGNAPPAAESGPPPSRMFRSREALVDAEGNFCVRGLAEGRRYRFTLWIDAPPAAPRRASGVEALAAFAGERGLLFQLKPEAALRGRVVDAQSGAPLEDFCVWAGVGRERLLRSDKGEAQRRFEDGRFSFPDLRPSVPPKPALLRIRASGYKEHLDKNVTLASGGPTDLGEIRLSRAPQVRVRVLDARDHGPVAGARVLCGLQDKGDPADYLSGGEEQEYWGDLNWQFARSAADGSASFNAEPGKTIALRADARGFLDSETKKLLLPAEGDADVVLELGRGGSVRVRVRDAAGQAVSGVGIAHKQPAEAAGGDQDWEVDSAEETSDEAGEARFVALAPGVHSFRVHDQVGQVWHQAGSAQGTQGWVQATVAEGSETALEFVAPPRGALHGTLREGGRPLEGASLRLVELRDGEEDRERGWLGPNDPLGTSSDHLGQFRFAGLRCGRYTLVVHHPGRRMPARVEVEVRPGDREFDLDLDVTAVDGRVTDVAGHPLAGLEVWAYVPGQEGWGEEPYQMVLREDERGGVRLNYEQKTRRSEHTDAQGRYELRGLPPNVPLVVHVEGDVVETFDAPPITLSPDELRHGLDFALRLAGTIRLELAGAEGQNRWYEVRALLVRDGKEEPKASGWLGNWNRREELRALPPGHYKLCCAPQGQPGDTPPQVLELDLHEGETLQASFQAH